MLTGSVCCRQLVTLSSQQVQDFMHSLLLLGKGYAATDCCCLGP